MSARISVSGFAFLASLVSCGGVADAQQAPFSPPPAGPSWYGSQAGQRPRPPLFRAPPLEVPPPQPLPDISPRQTTPPGQSAALKPRIVCGMTLIPAPKIDPKIAPRQTPARPANPPAYTIRPLQPPICWE